jgi:hypothetical protein
MGPLTSKWERAFSMILRLLRIMKMREFGTTLHKKNFMNLSFENNQRAVQQVLTCNNASIFTGQKPGILCLFTPGDATSLKVALEGISSKVIWDILSRKINTLEERILL